MNPSDQSRINAIISYFFLGPIFLCARSGTPLADPYVRSHAKKSSTILLGFFVALGLYFLVRTYIAWTIPLIGVDLRTLLLVGLMVVTVLLLLKGAYEAFRGIETDMSRSVDFSPLRQYTSPVRSYAIEGEEEKIRIIMSMIPLFGILVSSRYPSNPLITRGRILSTMCLFLYIFSVILSGEGSFLSVVVLIAGILFIVVESVYIILFGTFLTFGIFEKIPSYREIEAIILALFGQIYEFIRVSMGSEKRYTLRERYEYVRIEIEEKNTDSAPTPYFMPPALLGVPFWNIFGIPTLFISQYRPYRWLALQGLIITGIIAISWGFFSITASPWLLLLLFPIFHIFAYASLYPDTRTPGIGFVLLLLEQLISTLRSRKTTQSEKYAYGDSSIPPESVPEK